MTNVTLTNDISPAKVQSMSSYPTIQAAVWHKRKWLVAKVTFREDRRLSTAWDDNGRPFNVESLCVIPLADALASGIMDHPLE